MSLVFSLVLVVIAQNAHLVLGLTRGGVTYKANTNAVDLLTLFDALGGKSWLKSSGWSEHDESADPCNPSWYGVVCSAGQVTELHLFRNNLCGTLPSQFVGLRSLEVVNLSENDIRGPITAFLGDKAHAPVDLRDLRLASNRLTGEIPAAVNTKTALVTLDLSNNDLNGKIPTEMSGLASSMKYMDLSGNDLEGSVATSLCSLTSLLQLSLSENKLTGTIPICLLTQLTGIQLLDLSVNPLIGQLPPALAGGGTALQDLRQLSLANTRIGGPIPAWIWSLPSLRELTLSYSDFQGPLVPVNAAVSAPLTSVQASNCNLTGAVPPSLCDATELQVLDLGRNALTGELPICIHQWKQLTRLSLGSNKLSGAVPDGLGGLPEVISVDLSQNKLEALPASICGMHSLDIFDVSYNPLKRLSEGTCEECMNVSMSLIDLSETTTTSETLRPMLPLLGRIPLVSIRANSIDVLDFDVMFECVFEEIVDAKRDRDVGLQAGSKGLQAGSKGFQAGSKGFQAGSKGYSVISTVRNLDASSNGISRLKCEEGPETYQGYPFQISTLLLSENNLTSAGAGDCLGLGSWEVLEEVDLSVNQLESFMRPRDPRVPFDSQFFPGASELRSILAGYNQLRSFEEGIQYERLQTLSLAENCPLHLTTTQLPPALIELDLSGTLSELTDDDHRWRWSRLDNLQGLNLYRSNYSGQIPSELGTFNALRSLDLRSNEHCFNRSGRGVPSFLAPSSTYDLVGGGGWPTYSCPSFFVPNASDGEGMELSEYLRVYLDPLYYEYDLCRCTRGTSFGSPPFCVECPDNANCGSSDPHDDPQCYPGYFYSDLYEKCELCDMAGSFCPGNSSPHNSLEAQHGWWRNTSSTHTDTVVFLPCYSHEACHGGVHSDHHCGDGYEGPRCARCSYNYYLHEGGECFPCKSNQALTSVLQIVLIFGFVLFAGLYISGKSNLASKANKSRVQSIRTLAAAGDVNKGLLLDNSSDDSDTENEYEHEHFEVDHHSLGDEHKESSLEFSAHSLDFDETENLGGRSSKHQGGAGQSTPGRREKGQNHRGSSRNSHEDKHNSHAHRQGNHGHGHGHDHEHDQVAHAEHAYHRLHLMVYFVQIILNSKIIEELVSDNAESTGKMHKAVFFADEIVFYAYNTFTQVVTCGFGVDFNVQFLLIIAAPAVFIVGLTALQKTCGLQRMGLKFLLVCTLFYSGITVACIHMLTCDYGSGQYDGKWYLLRDFRIECSSTNGFWVFNYVVACAMIVGWTAGIPVLLGATLRRTHIGAPGVCSRDGPFRVGASTAVRGLRRCGLACAQPCIYCNSSTRLSCQGVCDSCCSVGSHALVAASLLLTAVLRPCCMFSGDFEQQISEQDAVALCGRADHSSVRRLQAAIRRKRAGGKVLEGDLVAPGPGGSGGLLDGPMLSRMPGYGINRSGRRFAVRPQPCQGDVIDDMALAYPLVASILMCGGAGTGGCCSDGEGGCTREAQGFARDIFEGEYRLGLRQQPPGYDSFNEQGKGQLHGSPAMAGYGSLDATSDCSASSAKGELLRSPRAMKPLTLEEDTSDEDEERRDAKGGGSDGSEAGVVGHNVVKSRFGSLTFLTSDYADAYFWWECVELSKTTVFNAVFRQKSWGELGQFSLATALAFVFLLLYVGLRPFRDYASNVEAIAMNAVLCVLCFSGLLLQLCQASLLAGVTTADQSKIEMMQDTLKIVMLITLLAWAALFAWQIVVLALGHTVTDGIRTVGGYVSKLCFPCMYQRPAGNSSGTGEYSSLLSAGYGSDGVPLSSSASAVLRTQRSCRCSWLCFRCTRLSKFRARQARQVSTSESVRSTSTASAGAGSLDGSRRVQELAMVAGIGPGGACGSDSGYQSTPVAASPSGQIGGVGDATGRGDLVEVVSENEVDVELLLGCTTMRCTVHDCGACQQACEAAYSPHVVACQLACGGAWLSICTPRYARRPGRRSGRPKLDGAECPTLCCGDISRCMEPIGCCSRSLALCCCGFDLSEPLAE